MGLGETPKFPVRAHGEAWNQGILADATLEFRGSGLVGTAYGFPGLSATLVATGVVDIRYPVVSERGMRIYPHVLGTEGKGPTGALLGPLGSGGFAGAQPGFSAHMSHVGGQSGSALLNITTNAPTPTAVGAATGLRPINPPTGAIVNLQFLASPIRRY